MCPGASGRRGERTGSDPTGRPQRRPNGILGGQGFAAWPENSCLTAVHFRSGVYVHVVDDADAMQRALEEARAAPAHGDVPVGAVALLNGSIVASAHNERERRNDPTAHAEILVLRAAAASLGTWRLERVTLVVTLEPCAMCAGALWAARVGRLVFGAADMKAGACGSLYNLCADPRLNHEVAITSGVLAPDAGSLLTKFFAERRDAAQ